MIDYEDSQITNETRIVPTRLERIIWS